MMANKEKVFFSTDSNMFVFLNRLYKKIEQTIRQDPHPALMIATHHFKEPEPFVNEIEQLSLTTIDLLIRFAYPSLSGYGKLTISYIMKRSYGNEFSFTIGPAIPLTNQENE